LVGSYALDQRQERPTAAQIAEAVQACAHLKWAEERQRLKSVCGDGLRLVDLDRVYREVRRNLERQSLLNSQQARDDLINSM
jgi:hypothetical protein